MMSTDKHPFRLHCPALPCPACCLVCALLPADVAHLQQRYGDSCPTTDTGTIKGQGQQGDIENAPVNYKDILEVSPSTPITNAVQFADLKALGWDVARTGNNVATRPSTTTAWWGATSHLPVDFYSVMCNGFRRVVDVDGTCDSRDGAEGLKGIVHVRANCSDNSLWILTYAFADRGFSTTTGDMWVIANCTDTGCTNGNGPKTAKYLTSGTAADGSCDTGSTDPGCTGASCQNGVCDICCNNMWPIVDNSVWVGYMAKLYYGNPTGNATAFWDTMLVHWDWAENTDGTGAAQTASISRPDQIPGFCALCTSKSGGCTRAAEQTTIKQLCCDCAEHNQRKLALCRLRSR